MQHIAKFMRRTKDIKPYNDPKSGFTRVVSSGSEDARLAIYENYKIHKVCGPFRHPKFSVPIYVYFCEDL
ncbi:hypothetical protein LCGC14_0460750 [marine sediment metagenome]|uniref:Uncharacterized protein n=1 Tax=marine sediment metagenome TaxID=412755 RepID=A0A0F9VNW4_9ZZZZ|nr:hypothetical protein [bacterium]